MSQPYIVVGTPCYGGLLTKSYVVSLMQTAFLCMREGITLQPIFLGNESLITRARNQIMSDFLETPQATHLMFIDADISFAPEQFLRLVRHDKDVVAASYPVKNVFWEKIPNRAAQGEPLEQAGLIYTGVLCTGAARRVENGFVTAEHAATGFLLIKRAAIERMIAAYPETKFRWLDTPRPSLRPRETLYALFDCEIDRENGQYLSEDYAFCRRWRKLGGEIWVDLSSRLSHEGTFQFNGDVSQRFAKAMTENNSGS